MAGVYPYALAPNKLPKLFEQIKGTGVPGKVTDAWLKQVGFTSSNDARLKGVLKFIGFTDGSGTPTQKWRDYRGANSSPVLAEAIRSGYADLFRTYPDAQNRRQDDIATYMRGQSSLSNDTIRLAVATFFGLAQLADFTGGTSSEAHAESGTGSSRDESSEERYESVGASRTAGPSMTVNVNVQLTLPESKDSEVYEALFSAMSKHLLSGNTSS